MCSPGKTQSLRISKINLKNIELMLLLEEKWAGISTGPVDN